MMTPSKKYRLLLLKWHLAKENQLDDMTEIIKNKMNVLEEFLTDHERREMAVLSALMDGPKLPCEKEEACPLDNDVCKNCGKLMELEHNKHDISSHEFIYKVLRDNDII